MKSQICLCSFIVLNSFFGISFAKTPEEQYIREFYSNCYSHSDYAITDLYAESGQWKAPNEMFERAMNIAVKNPSFKQWSYSNADSDYYVGYGRVNYNSLNRGVCMMAATNVKPDLVLALLKKEFTLTNLTDSNVNSFNKAYEWKTKDVDRNPIWVTYATGDATDKLVILGVTRK